MSKPPRRFSQGSNLVTSYIRDLISKDSDHDPQRGLPYLQTLSEYSLQVAPFCHQGLWEEDPFLIDRRMSSALVEAGLINWCPGIKKLVPLAVSNDGNTLCHSASLSLWGVHDRKLDLRHLIMQALQSQAQTEFRTRWQKEVSAARTKLQGLAFHHDVEAEWQVLMELASDTNKSARSSTPMYEPLEEFHIFVLANILRRPILVFADRPIRSVEVEEITSHFAALYLPLLWSSDKCYRSPLVLGYCDNYFAPLVIFGDPSDKAFSDPCPVVVPLVGADKIPIENRYLTTSEELIKDELIKDYLLLAEVETTKSSQITHILTVAKLISNPLPETQQLLSEFLRSRKNPTSKLEYVENKVVPPPIRRISKFKCGNKVCSKFIDKDHLFPYCSECYPKFSSTIPKVPNRRKMNSATTVVAPTSLEVECATLGCPYYAAVNCFPHCQRCHLLKNPNQQSSPNQQSEKQKVADLTLEDRWQNLAMGVVDNQLISGMGELNTKFEHGIGMTEDEILFTNLHRHIPVEDGEKCVMGGVTSTRSQPMERLQKLAATGARSAPQRKVSREELELATNAVNIDDWKRKVSWINEPCTHPGCSYFASVRTYPYCNQCAAEIANTPNASMQRNRKVSATCTLTTLLQED